ncbi:MAG: HAD family hydrolase [Ruminococcus sp.]|nr:HAD family hydrolase [Ruminococcus sp.]
MHLFISDLDGTLLNNAAELSPFTCAALSRLIGQGLAFTAATARTIASAGKILAPLPLSLPVILMNGVLIYDPLKKDYIQINRLAPDLCRIALQEMDSRGLEPFMYTVSDGEMHTLYRRFGSPAMEQFYSERRQKYYKSFSRTPDLSSPAGDVIYFTLIDRRERLAPLYDALSRESGFGLTFYRDIYSEDMWYLEVFSSAASKENGVRFLREHCRAERVTVFGDNLNDLPMFRAADRRIAVANAAQEVKGAADLIIGANTEDGVARFLEENFVSGGKK